MQFSVLHHYSRKEIRNSELEDPQGMLIVDRAGQNTPAFYKFCFTKVTSHQLT